MLLQSRPLLAYPFRVFFLVTGLYALTTLIAWMALLFGGLQLPLGWSPLHWHSHEMLFGLVPAAIAGFLLTAICNWTGSSPLRGWALFGLVLLWLAGRVAFWTASWWPALAVAAIDMLFLLALALYVIRVLLQHGNKRNLPIAAILALLALANLFMHIGFISGDLAWLQRGEWLAFGLISMMMIAIGGRIIPMFTRNWLRQHNGSEHAVKTYGVLERAVIISTLLSVVLDFIPAAPWLAGAVALTAGAFNLARLLGWAGWQTTKEPLLWILHLGYGWIVAGFLLKGAAAFDWVPASAWQHALGAGAMGTLILGVMTRVALGHTGRSLQLPAYGVSIYIAISLAALTRILVALNLFDYRAGLSVAAAGWVIAFALFVFFYWPILTRPRVDGRPG